MLAGLQPHPNFGNAIYEISNFAYPKMISPLLGLHEANPILTYALQTGVIAKRQNLYIQLPSSNLHSKKWVIIR